MTAYTFAENLAIILLWETAGCKSLDEADSRVIELASHIPHSAASISHMTSDFTSLDRADLALKTGGKVRQTREAYKMFRRWETLKTGV
jgi:hypothetical protein